MDAQEEETLATNTTISVVTLFPANPLRDLRASVLIILRVLPSLRARKTLSATR